MQTNYLFKEYNKAYKYIHIAFLALCVCILSYDFFENIENTMPILALGGSFLALAMLRHFVRMKGAFKLWRFISPAIELLLVFPIVFFTKSLVSLWLAMIIANDIIIDYDFKYSIIFVSIGYLLYITFYMLKLTPPNLTSGIMLFIVGALQYGVFMSAGYIGKKYYIQNDEYKRLAAEQKAQMLKLEQMAALKERNRIAGEIHDTVGHQLTTALIQIEAASMLIESDKDETKRRLGIVKDQVKTGLNELRNSIRQVSEQDMFDDFETALLNLAKTVKNSTGINIENHFVNTNGIPVDMRKTIYYICMEAITNGIRHGRCSKVWWSVVLENGYIAFEIENNGKHPDDIKPGFGINRMKRQMGKIGGILDFSSGSHGLKVSGRIEL